MDLKIDGYSSGPRRLDDMEWIRRGLVEMAEWLGVEIANGPTVVSFKESSGKPESGLSGFAIITTSHLAIHTWPETGYICVDVSSCKPFYPEIIKEAVVKFFQIREIVYYKVDDERPAPPMFKKLLATS